MSTFNGWANYETWLVNLHMDNDQASQESFLEMAQDVVSSVEASEYLTKEQEERYQLADRIKEAIEVSTEANESSLASDLVRAALGNVNWNEIADSWLAQAREELAVD